jgi:hypothetical protein
MVVMDLTLCSPAVREIVMLNGGIDRPLPLVSPRRAVSAEAASRLRSAGSSDLFPGARSPEGALAGLWVHCGCFDEAHAAAQDLATVEGSYWHGIVHRQEPDDWNSGYWFRRAGRHPVFEALGEQAREVAARHGTVASRLKANWDPFAFIDLCAEARGKPGTPLEALALDLQLLEWRLLFEWCARRALKD